jgi:hypothetical protein
MKQIIALFAGLLITTWAQARILGSNLELDHQALIESSIQKNCHLNPFILEQLSSKEEAVKVDQGITDVYFTTILLMKVRIDQAVFNHYHVAVKSILFDQYDHKNKRWGAYSIDAITCREVTKL